MLYEEPPRIPSEALEKSLLDLKARAKALNEGIPPSSLSLTLLYVLIHHASSEWPLAPVPSPESLPLLFTTAPSSTLFQIM